MNVQVQGNNTARKESEAIQNNNQPKLLTTLLKELEITLYQPITPKPTYKRILQFDGLLFPLLAIMPLQQQKPLIRAYFALYVISPAIHQHNTILLIEFTYPNQQHPQPLNTLFSLIL